VPSAIGVMPRGSLTTLLSWVCRCVRWHPGGRGAIHRCASVPCASVPSTVAYQHGARHRIRPASRMCRFLPSASSPNEADTGWSRSGSPPERRFVPSAIGVMPRGSLTTLLLWVCRCVRWHPGGRGATHRCAPVPSTVAYQHGARPRIRPASRMCRFLPSASSPNEADTGWSRSGSPPESRFVPSAAGSAVCAFGDRCDVGLLVGIPLVVVPSTVVRRCHPPWPINMVPGPAFGQRAECAVSYRPLRHRTKRTPGGADPAPRLRAGLCLRRLV
jgi:hypothetical protein